ncbi:MAG: archease [Desulfobacterales bacterium]|nr:archease [Desulfobacteraceae bacterium]MBT7696499.1 archease [Desulfobacterales bacterium]
MIDHTADFGIRVSGSDLKDLFENTAYAMFDLIIDAELSKDGKEFDISVSGYDLPDLMFNWLRELLYLFAGKEMVIKKADIVSISENRLSARITYSDYDPGRHEIKNEIKAVTYHQLKVENKSDGWETIIIFDV